MRLPPFTAAVLALVLLAGALAGPGTPQGAPVCALDPARAVQDDGDSGRDAGDGPAGAVAVVRDDYMWGWLDPAVRGVATDSDDWYAAWVPAGGRTVTFGIVDLLDYRPPVPPTYLVTFHARVLAPDGTTHETDSAAHDNVTVPSTVAGPWLVHVTADVVAQGPVTCAEARAPLEGQGVWPHDAADYGVYFGCNPVCFERR